MLNKGIISNEQQAADEDSSLVKFGRKMKETVFLVYHSAIRSQRPSIFLVLFEYSLCYLQLLYFTSADYVPPSPQSSLP
ncbi:MAG: hypothetical protein P4M11_12340 [Candidatus Pacebacteria bacterium]|nr:hypothetical protein [Candidatus Paceibacterota bacterium]